MKHDSINKKAKLPSFLTPDRIIALSVVALFVFLAYGNLLQAWELTAYDIGMRLSDRKPSDQIAIVAIDDKSIAKLGKWPWQRDIHARAVEVLSNARAKAIGDTVVYFSPQVEPGLSYVNKLINFYENSTLKHPTDPLLTWETQALQKLLAEAQQNLDKDNQLATSIAKSGNTILAMTFQAGESPARLPRPLPAYLENNTLKSVYGISKAKIDNALPYTAAGFTPPIPEIGQPAAGIGFLSSDLDKDGIRRTEPLVMNYAGKYFPSLSFLVAIKSLNFNLKDVKVELGKGITLGKNGIPTGKHLEIFPHYYHDVDDKPPFQIDSFYDVYNGNVALEKYFNKIVLIGTTASGTGATQMTPIAPSMPSVISLAHRISSILQNDHYETPTWAPTAQWAVFAVVALYLIFWLPGVNVVAGAMVSLAMLIGIIGGHFILMSDQGLWVQLILPAALLLTGYTLISTRKAVFSEQPIMSGMSGTTETKPWEDSHELGLAFLNRGQLELAFEKFRECPIDDTVKDLLYRLAVEFEGRGEPDKSRMVFQYIANHDFNYRDLKTRLKVAAPDDRTVIIERNEVNAGDAATVQVAREPARPIKTVKNAPPRLTDTVQPELIGSFEIEKEIGQGATGIVYFGVDPESELEAAVKTIALSQEFDEDELEEIKTRFFKEAETAAGLNHPNIIKLYEVGEDDDLVYIAMEYAPGDLSAYTNPPHLLSIDKVVDVISAVAEALNYAHSKGVIHRDIKPANIMYDSETGAVKVTDFGMARLGGPSKTKTGVVLGTPYYMSPEQLAGQKLDGRSDIFSLGITLYQLLAGQLPFQGEFMAELLFKIANEPPLDIAKIRPELPIHLVAIITKMLQKAPDRRYQSGSEVAQALNKCKELLRPARRAS